MLGLNQEAKPKQGGFMKDTRALTLGKKDL